MAPTQQKALALESKQGQFKLVDVDVPKPGPGQILVKAHSSALNPVDWKIWSNGIIIELYPAVLGTDGAGTVEALGAGVSAFQVGDKVFGETFFNNAHATFQQYYLANVDLVARVPDNVSLDEAASIPVGLVTAALGLYHDGRLEQSAGLLPPWEARGADAYGGKPFVVLGGATSVGQFVIQLAKLSGFSPIITSASPHNVDLLTSLGATHVLDRHLSGAALAAEVRKVTAAPIPVVYDAASLADTQNAGYELVAPGGVLVIVLFDAVEPAKKTPEKRISHVFGQVNVDYNRAVGQGLFAKLTGWLESGAIKPNRVEILPGGLAGIPDGLERLRQDKVSGAKLIARPQETQ